MFTLSARRSRQARAQLQELDWHGNTERTIDGAGGSRRAQGWSKEENLEFMRQICASLTNADNTSTPLQRCSSNHAIFQIPTVHLSDASEHPAPSKPEPIVLVTKHLRCGCTQNPFPPSSPPLEPSTTAHNRNALVHEYLADAEIGRDPRLGCLVLRDRVGLETGAARSD